MNTLRRRLLGAALAAAAGAAAAEPRPRPWPKGRATPPLILPTVDGAPWDLVAQRGRPVVLNFWATWCEPCRAEMPTLELLAARHERDGVVVAAVNFKESAASIRRFTDQTLVTIPILRDADGQAARAWGAAIFPTTVLVGRDGRALASVIGEVDWLGEDARRWIAALL